MKFKNKYRTKSLRLSGWDYSADGYYFVTICAQNRENIFGEIKNGEIILSEIGKIVENFWHAIPTHFANVKLDEFVVMPNHVHGIVIIDNTNPCCRNAINRVSTENNDTRVKNPKIKSGGITGASSPMGKKSLGEIIRWFKGRCSFEIHQIHPALDRVWQPRFHDQIISDKEGLNRIREYIWRNPENWDKDEENLRL